MHQPIAHTAIVVAILIFVLCSFAYSIYRINRQSDTTTVDTVVRHPNYHPTRAHHGDAGADLKATRWTHIPVGGREMINTGVAVAIPDGYVGLLFSRSGHGLSGVSLANSVGVIDAGYTGEIRVTLENNGDTPFEVHPGHRVAQLVIVPMITPAFRDVDELPTTDRGHKGFGSTGVK